MDKQWKRRARGEGAGFNGVIKRNKKRNKNKHCVENLWKKESGKEKKYPCVLKIKWYFNTYKSCT